MNPIEDGRFEQRAVDPAAAYAPAVLLAFFILLFSAFVATEAVALSFGRQPALGPNVAGVYPPTAGLTWELKCFSGHWAVCRLPRRFENPLMDPRIFSAWYEQSRRRREATLHHFAVQHVIWLVGIAIAFVGGFAVGRWRYRSLERAQRSQLHGSSQFATWDELRDAGYIAGVEPVLTKKSP